MRKAHAPFNSKLEHCQIAALRQALKALRDHGSQIPLERARLIVDCATDAIDSIKICTAAKAAQRKNHDTKQDQG